MTVADAELAREAVGPERVLEAAFAVPVEARDAVREPAGLGEWLCSRVRFDGEAVELVVEEEYGYRRMLGCVLERAGDGYALRVERAEREWDGCDGTPVGPVAPASRWAEPALVGTTLAVTVRGKAAVVRWSGFAASALDATRREGVLLRHAVDRARALAVDATTTDESTAASGVIHAVERVLDVSPGACWSVLDEGALLRPDPGTGWSFGDVSGRVLVAVARRRVGSSWRADDDENHAGMLDVYMGHETDGRTSLRAELVLAHADAHAARWLDDLVDSLVESTSTRRNACESW